MVIHNICIDVGDMPVDFLEADWDDESINRDNDPNIEDIEATGYGGILLGEDAGQVPAYETDDWQKEEGRRKREMILDQLFPLQDFL